MSYQDDLDCLARNVKSWPDNAKFAAWFGDGKPVFYEHFYENITQFSRYEVQSRRAELQNKPSWGQHSWPQIFQNEDGHWFGARDGWDFYAHIGRGWKGDGVSMLRDDGEYLQTGTVLGDWRDTLEKRPADMSEAAATDRLKEATQNVLAAVPALKDEKYRFEWELKLVDVYKNQEEIYTSADCWCRTCQPVTITNMRFVVCPECGNKRCPKTNDHRNACTGSNEPGQAGSAYPADTKGQDMDNSTYWHERGELPPVGMVCEVFTTSSSTWIEVEVIAHRDGAAICWSTKEKRGLYTDDFEDFRPLRAERDELIEIILSCNMSEGILADAILAAGFTRKEAV